MAPSKTKIWFPLLLGGLIYLLFRPIALLFFSGLIALDCLDGLILIRQLLAPIALPDWLIYNLPGALWLYAFVNFSLTCGTNKHHSLVLPILLSIGSEGAQFFNWLPGTFDYLDLSFYSLAIVVALYGQTSKFPKVNVLPYSIAYKTFGIALFTLLAVSFGPSDAFQDLVIETEEDPVRKAKMRAQEDTYLYNGEVAPSQEQIDSINNAVDSLYEAGELPED